MACKSYSIGKCNKFKIPVNCPIQQSVRDIFGDFETCKAVEEQLKKVT